MLNVRVCGSNMRQKIEGILPFNDLWYLDCLMQNIIPIICFYNKAEDFFKNDKTIYEVKGEALSNVNIDLLSRKYLSLYLERLGLTYVEISRIEDPIPFLLSEIARRVPTICSIDCFYEQQRIDTYKKVHCAHTVLVYGCDLKRKMFTILEHDYINSLCFREKEISFQELVLCMEGYAKYRPNDSMIQIHLGQKTKYDILSKEERLENDKNLFWRIVKEAIYNLDYGNCKKLIEILSTYVKCKKIKLLRSNLNRGENRAVRNAGILMALIAKYQQTQKIKIETREYCKELIDEILGIEGNETA